MMHASLTLVAFLVSVVLCLPASTYGQMTVDGTFTLNGGSTNIGDMAECANDSGSIFDPCNDATTYIYETTNTVTAGGTVSCTFSCSTTDPFGYQWLSVKFGSAQEDILDGDWERSGFQTCDNSVSATNDSGCASKAYVAATHGASISGATLSCTGDVARTGFGLLLDGLPKPLKSTLSKFGWL